MAKRAFDIVASSLAILVLSPLLGAIMLILRLTGEGKIFYAQERVGQCGKPFRMLKFATMLENSPSLAGGDITIENDPRILPMGRFLRKTKINELPQIFNILRGDMSIIGPRPLTIRVAALFPTTHWTNIASLRPGLSGVGSIAFRDEETLLGGVQDRQKVYSEIIVPYKMALEDWYVKHLSVAVDIKLITLTIWAVLRPGLQIERYFENLPRPSNEFVQMRAQASTRAY